MEIRINTEILNSRIVCQTNLYRLTLFTMLQASFYWKHQTVTKEMVTKEHKNITTLYLINYKRYFSYSNYWSAPFQL